MVKAGFKYIFLFLIFSLIFFFVGGLLNYIFGSIFLILAIFCIYFFRDPTRKIGFDENQILSPADGTVFEISDIEESLVIKGRAKVVKIFLSVLDVHLQRAPISGKITYIKKESGKFLPANHPDAAVKNTQNLVGINGQMSIYIKQIAGIIAQKCELWVKLDDVIKQGEKIGLIHFGSQVDIYLPENIKLKVAVGNKVKAGITVIGEIIPEQ
ncbi:MAG: phosphatidylserine decarboxylase [Elusimicrobiota bacterium]